MQQAVYAKFGASSNTGSHRAQALVAHVYSKQPELTRIEGKSKAYFDARHQAKVDAGVAAQHDRLPNADTFLTQREIATGQGYTGDACPRCQAFAMLRAGTCLTCQACGSTTGCA